MTRIYTYLQLLSVYLLLSACADSQEKSNEELRQEVIAIHDEVMPEMGPLKLYRTEVLDKIRELSEDSIQNESKIQELQVLEQDLHDAFEEMFVWMRQFKRSYEEWDEEKTTQYLLEQKVWIEKVNADIKEALAAAELELEK
jgi:hypothetical protein